jgi:hypothetical protein
MNIPQPTGFDPQTSISWPSGVTKLVVLVTKGGTLDASGAPRDWLRAFLVDVDAAAVVQVFDLYPEDEAAFLKAIGALKQDRGTDALTVMDYSAQALKGHDPDPPPKRKGELPSVRMLTVATQTGVAVGRIQDASYDFS